MYFLGGGLVIGGTAPSLPPIYWDEVCRLLLQLEDEPWQEWWLAAQDTPCWVMCWIGGGRSIVRVRRSTTRVSAIIDRHYIWERRPGAGSPPPPGVDEARDDVEALIRRFQTRFPLGPSPDLL